MSRSEQVIALWVAVLFACVLYLAAGSWMAAHWDGSTVAAWIQAIGSIAAIVAASQIAARQMRAAQEQEKQRRAEDDLRKLNSVYGLLARIVVTCKNMQRVWGDYEAPGRYEALRDFEDARLERIAAALGALPPFEIPDASLLIFLTGIPDAVTSLHSIWLRTKREWEMPPESVQWSAEGQIPPALSEVLSLAQEAMEICGRVAAERRQSLLELRDFEWWTSGG